MDKTYQPQTIEQKWYKTWEQQGYFEASDSGKPYCIMIPPPNVTGNLHMGHAFQDTLMDTLIRYHRMQGDATHWQPGTDHAGIATQMVVERLINTEGSSRQDYGRDKFCERVWQWKHQSGGEITQQLRRMGSSLDWRCERFTMDEGLSRAVRRVFVQLYDEGLIYRGKRLVNWDPVLQTAVSDLEVSNSPENGFMHTIKYPFVDGEGFMQIATTRPETMLADGALAVNPNDKRYQNLIGKMVWVPLCARQIPIVADDYVDMEFGTGCVKITPAHDFNDWQVGKRHKMEIINLFTNDAKMNQNAPKAYQGMDRFAARELILQDLKTQDLLVASKPHQLTPPRGDRSGAILEPYLTNQWFVKIAPLAQPAIDAVKNGDIRFVPQNWAKTYFNWMENIEDWCISRQIWWGHRIPAWFDDNGKIYVADNLAAAQSQAGVGVRLTQETDVLDTWFSSALWPFSTLGWPDNTAELAKFYPTSVLVTGFDIIFFWVARMIMFGLKFTGQVPFKEVYIHGLVRDSDGQKMSKSKGNVLDPIDLIDGISLDKLLAKRSSGLMQPKMAAKIAKQTQKHFPDGIAAFGTDALRFTFASLASTGRDISFDLARVTGYRNFCNKLWNAARYVLQNTQGEDIGNGDLEFSLADRWIVSKLQHTESCASAHLDKYRFDLLAHQLYEFLWNEYCDWYLEMSKAILLDLNASPAQKRGTRRTLLEVLEAVLRLLHPLCPFITEEIWQQIAPLAGKSGATIMLQPYPTPDTSKIAKDSEKQMEWVLEFVMGVRKIRGKMDIAAKKPLPVLLANASSYDHQLLAANQNYLLKLANLQDIKPLAANSTPPESATALVGEMQILIPLAGLIDKDLERQRLAKEIENIDKLLPRIEGKLANENFVSKAPPAVLAKERDKLAASLSSRANLQSQLDKIS